MKISNKTAQIGEEKACEYLRKLGYKIIERNFRKGYGEIDVIAIDRNDLVFIEVKTRRSNKFGEPFEAINFFKLRTMIKTAHYYKKLYPNLPESLRIDAISVMIFENRDEIKLIKNISGY